MSPLRSTDAVAPEVARYRLHRAGVLNVWQYDSQVFEFAGGRLLLRGANGAGKSKTLEMLLPFVLDGDKLRITASGQHHTSLLWLMTDGHDGNRTGYVWVEFAREGPDGDDDVLTCGIGIRASSTARAASTWFFCCPRRVGDDLMLEDDAGPLSKERCRAAVATDGHFFESARPYKQHVGQVLFGLAPDQYDELLRLLYWLRQPQVGEDIAPARLAEQLSQALPQLDDGTVRSVGDAFDELAAFGDQIDRRARAADAVTAFAQVYAAYARGVVRARAGELAGSQRELGRRQRALDDARDAVERHRAAIAETEQRLRAADGERREHQDRQRALETGPEARTHQRLLDLDRRAEQATTAATRATDNADQAARRATALAGGVRDDAGGLIASVSDFDRESREVVRSAVELDVHPSVSLPAADTATTLDDDQRAAAAGSQLDEQVTALVALRAPLGERLAAVEVVEDARRAHDAAESRRQVCTRAAEEAAERAEADRLRRDEAAQAATAAEEDFGTAVRAWHTDSRGVPLELPELTASAVPTLGALARTAAEPELARLRSAEAGAAAERVAAQQLLARLAERRRVIEAERDPAPPAPSLPRTPRDVTAGAALWRLLDFHEAVPPRQRAGLEAALQASGLLDAWVRRDGTALAADRDDVVLAAGPSVSDGAGLGRLLRPDPPAGCPVTPQVVEQVLARVASEPVAGSAAAVGVDGSWRLGPLVGRASKQAAQYVGATARASERSRRLAEVDVEARAAEGQRDRAHAAETAARERRTGVEGWLAAVPEHTALLTAWALLDERGATLDRSQAAAQQAEQAARDARVEAAELHRRLDELATQHGLPVTAQALATRREQLREVSARATRHADAAGQLQDRLHRWVRDWRGWQTSVELAEGLSAQARQGRSAADRLAAERDELRAAAGADVRQLQERLTQVRAQVAGLEDAERRLRAQLDRSRELLGSGRSEHTTAQQRHREQHLVVVAAAQALGELRDAPGLLVAADVDGPAAADPAGSEATADDSGPVPADAADSTDVVYELARGVTADATVPAAVLRAARRLAALPEPGRPADATAVHAAWRDVATSDAADHEPRVVSAPGTAGVDLLAALGRDDGGEYPISVLADRLTAAVRRDRELLTDRERRLFEEHLIGDLGEVLRRRRLDAEDLVASMNRLLGGVTTSQGIAVRLTWTLRDDVAEDAQRAVDLLGQPVGALLPDERAELRDSLHRLIEASRTEAPEEPYTEHLARALDYRRWYAFRIRYTRPELVGRWQDLHRRSPLSQGEQKVVCYLPLFAAAAAHFTSLAGAAPHAPRFVLLDDAFPKIDVRTHPLLFGLLVSLDLDFVVTSERLWGDHDTIPSLSIYEALRDPAERGIAQYRYTWDGARLQAVGA